MFGIDGPEFVVILIVALVIMGPEHVAGALKAFRKLVEAARRWSARLRAESSNDLSGVLPQGLDLPTFDLSQYDPRAMVRQAVQQEMHAWMEQAAHAPTTPAGSTSTAANPAPTAPPTPPARVPLADGPSSPVTPPTDVGVPLTGPVGARLSPARPTAVEPPMAASPPGAEGSPVPQDRAS